MRDARQRAAYRQLSRRGKAIGRLLTLAIVAGIGLAAWPLLSEALATTRAERTISTMASVADGTNDPMRLNLLSQAQAYNLRLGGEGARLDNEGMAGGNEGSADILTPGTAMDPTQALPYEEQLCLGDGMPACWVEAPSIDLAQPVYLGTDEATLAMGAGHLEWSSLPVGGSNTHCVIAAHSGMRETRMFDDLECLSEGDRFVVHTLGDAYCYVIYQTEVVKPEEARERCSITAGDDVCTLVTCTPYGINTHRLLVHGRRVAFEPQKVEPAKRISSIASNRRTRPLLILIVGFFALAGTRIMWALARRAIP